jgi:bifunctional lysine-specific demethylase and histidyl-hydroxylase NO66
VEADAIAWILDRPHSKEFVSEHLGRRWLHAKSERRDRFAELLSLAQLDEVLGTYGVRLPTIRLVRADEDIPASEYVWRDNMVDPAQAARLFSQGATVIFGALQDRHEGMRRLCSAVTAQVCARTQTNIYLTPPDSQGFKPHWDTHDVYVLQVEGSKRWRIYGGGPEHPLQDQKFDPKVHEPGEVEAEFTLHAGEVLYIPRGIMHAAVTTEEISLHITLGVMPYTWSDLLVDCVSEIVERSPEWRRNVPFAFASEPVDVDALKGELAKLAETLVQEVDLPTVVAERQRVFESSLRPRAADLLRQAAGAAAVSERDRVQWRPGVPGRIESRNDRVVVVSGGREVEFPDAATRTLRRLLSGDAVVASDVDDGLDWESRRVVLSALIREGLVASDTGPVGTLRA